MSTNVLSPNRINNLQAGFGSKLRKSAQALEKLVIKQEVTCQANALYKEGDSKAPPTNGGPRVVYIDGKKIVRLIGSHSV